MSADGTKLVAAAKTASANDFGSVFTSANSGATWVATGPPSNYWYSVASSADGSKLVAGMWGGGIYNSVDAGVTWAATSASSNWFNVWLSIASSADGTKLVAASHAGPILTSADSGTNWSVANSGYKASSAASSTDGNKLVTVSAGDYVVSISTNAGTNWTVTSVPLGVWQSVASSADGNHLVAATYQALLGGPGSVYTSEDGGITWLPTNVPDDYWHSVASSADGARFVAAGYGDQFRGGSIYISQSILKPSLNIKSDGGHIALSWIVHFDEVRVAVDFRFERDELGDFNQRAQPQPDQPPKPSDSFAGFKEQFLPARLTIAELA